MKIDEAIVHAIEGEAILFAGSGFNYGAKNIKGNAFPLGNELCERLIVDGNVDVTGDSPADKNDSLYIADKYLKTNTKRDLKEFVLNEFTCSSVSESQKTILGLPWQRIYTTNYDDVIETTSKQINVLRESIAPQTKIAEVCRTKNAIIHLNGSILNLTDASFDREFKLTMTSYQHRSLPDSDWAISLSNDLKTSRAIIIIGYSLDYDLELQQIFAEGSNIKDKCVFVTKNPTGRARYKMDPFGSVFAEGVEKFAEKVKEARASYKEASKDYRLYCFDEIARKKIVPSTSISDKDVMDLFVAGDIKLEHIFSSMSNMYVIQRDCVKNITEYLLDGVDEFKAVIIHSDLGNGKSIFVRELEQKLSTSGSVYHLLEPSDRLRNDLDYIADQKGYKYLFIEDYNRIIYTSNYAEILSLYIRKDIRFIFTVRSYLNENVFAQLVNKSKIPEKNLLIQDINYLSDIEIKSIYDILTSYNFWGERAADSRESKERYLKKKCKSELKNIVLDLLKSKEMSERIEQTVRVLFADEDAKDITLIGFISNLISVPLDLNDMIVLLKKQVQTGNLIKNNQISEFLDIKHNRYKLKSPLVAQHILTTYNYNKDVERIIIKILPVLDRNSTHYRHFLRMLISNSNLRLILNKDDKNYKQTIINIYQTAKSLAFHRENPFFWLQYAIACMDMKMYDNADTYLRNAESYYNSREVDSWQISTQRGRFLLETLYKYPTMDEVFVQFKKAHELLYNCSTKERYYPLRQTSLYKRFYDEYYSRLCYNDQVEFHFICSQMIDALKNEIEKMNLGDKASKYRADELARYKRELEIITNKISM